MNLSHRTLSVGLCLLLISGIVACHRGPDDATITTNVKAKLAATTPLATSVIDVSTRDGAVTLSGAVNSASAKSDAESAAKSVEGVKSVTNNLTVKAPVVNATPPPVSEDTKLKNDVTANLTKYGITGVTAAVANGEVTLTGDISRAKLQDAMKAANEAHPKKVLNKMTIK